MQIELTPEAKDHLEFWKDSGKIDFYKRQKNCLIQSWKILIKESANQNL